MRVVRFVRENLLWTLVQTERPFGLPSPLPHVRPHHSSPETTSPGVNPTDKVNYNLEEIDLGEEEREAGDHAEQVKGEANVRHIQGYFQLQRE